MRLRPCIRCNRAPTCEIKREKLKVARAAKLTMGKFTCSVFSNDYAPGRRVIVNLRTWKGDYPDADVVVSPFPGTAMRFDKSGKYKLLVLLDDKLNDEGYTSLRRIVKVWANTVVPLHDEPLRPVCEKCSLPTDTYVKEWSCECQSTLGAIVATGLSLDSLPKHEEECPF